MKTTLAVQMAENKVAKGTVILKSTGIGSCVVITIYDPVSKIGGMAHAMLPTIEDGLPELKKAADVYKFADSTIDNMVSKMIATGAKKNNFRAKLIGGAQMFKILIDENQKSIGDENVESAKKKLSELNIPIESEDIGGNIGRTVEFDLESGIISVSTKI